MNDKKAKRLVVFLWLAVFFLLTVYVGLAKYYKGGFSYGTWINGIYCTGKTVEEVNKELLKNCSYGGLTVYDAKGYSYEILPEEIGFSFDFEEALKAYLDRQNPYLWVDNLFAAKKKELIPVISYDEIKLKAVLEKIPALADRTREEERRVYIIKTYMGYELVNEREEVLDKALAGECIRNALLAFEERIDLKEQGCYRNLSLTAEMEAELARWEKISRFQSCRIIYSLGKEQVPVNAAVVCDWILLNEDGTFQYDEEGNLQPDDNKIEEFIDELADEYDTVGGTRHFKATRGEVVTIEGGIYGNRMDRRAEKEYLKQAFREKRMELHTPEYTQRGWEQGRDDIGDTYIEIDMTKQMMYYYAEGKLQVETPVVTGNTGRRMGTPEGVNYVYGKQENRILKGPDYASHVNFWMPVKGNIGIHDAAWRSEYGAEIYKTNGSHGCINTPYDAMSKLYGMAEVGTPVVMFY